MDTLKYIIKKSIWLIIFILIIFYFGLNICQKILNYDLSANETKIYVNPDLITVPDYNSEKKSTPIKSDLNFHSEIIFPDLLENDSFAYFSKPVSTDEISQKAKLPLKELKKEMLKDLNTSLEYSSSKNKELARLQNISKINAYKEEASKTLKEKLKENIPYRLKSSLELSSSVNKTQILNTENNRKNTNIYLAKYRINNNSYKNYWYLYEINCQRYERQLTREAEKEIQDKITEYENSERLLLNLQIQNSEELIDNVINDIKTKQEENFLDYRQISFRENHSDMIQKFREKEVQNKNFLKPIDKKMLITKIGKDNNYTVTFSKNKNLPDKTKEIQNLINRYGYLYRM